MKKIIRRSIFTILLTLLFLPLSGCTRKKDINQLSLATMIGIDKEPDSEDVIITVQVVNHLNLSRIPVQVTPIVTLSERGTTVFEAFRKVSSGFTSKVFISHFQILAFGEEAAKSGIEKYLSFFFLDHEAQHKFNLIIVKEQTARNFLKAYSVFSEVPALDYIQKLETGNSIVGISKFTQLPEVLNSIYAESNAFIISSFYLKGDIEKGQTTEVKESSEPLVNAWPSDLGIFKNDALVGYLDYEESIGYNFLTNDITNVVIPIEFDDRKISTEVRCSGSKTSIKVENGKPKVTFEVSAIAGVVADMSGQTQFGKDYANKSKAHLEEEIKNRAMKCIEKSQSLKADIFKIATSIHKDKPKYWKTIKDNFEDIYENIEFEVKVNVSIIRIRH